MPSTFEGKLARLYEKCKPLRILRHNAQHIIAVIAAGKAVAGMGEGMRGADSGGVVSGEASHVAIAVIGNAPLCSRICGHF